MARRGTQAGPEAMWPRRFLCCEPEAGLPGLWFPVWPVAIFVVDKTPSACIKCALGGSFHPLLRAPSQPGGMS
jgi:hypothetical protein